MIKCLQFGFPLHIYHPKKKYKLSQNGLSFVKNYREIYHIIDELIKDMNMGRITPINSPNLYSIPLFCVPKNKKELRLVRNASWKQSINEFSLNDIIDSKKCKIPTLPHIPQYAKLTYKYNWIACRDLKSAFRQITIRPQDRKYVGYNLFNLYFQENNIPDGVASSARICQDFSNLIIWIMKNKLIPRNIDFEMMVHIDDFTMYALNKKDLEYIENKFDTLCDDLGVILSHHKDIHSCRFTKVHGLYFNLKSKTISAPEDKLKKLVSLLNLTIKFKKIEAKTLDKICGKLFYFTQLQRQGKPLVRNILNIIHKLIRSEILRKNDIITLDDNIINDLKFWLKFSEYLTSCSMSNIISMPKISMIAATDASDLGGGYIINSSWSMYQFKPNDKKYHINVKELHVILSMIETFKSKLTGKTIEIFTDNTTVYYAIKNKWSTSTDIMNLIRKMVIILIKYKIFIWIKWVPTDYNVLADSLSRFDLKRFNQESNRLKIKIDKSITRTKYYDI